MELDQQRKLFLCSVRSSLRSHMPSGSQFFNFRSAQRHSVTKVAMTSNNTINATQGNSRNSRNKPTSETIQQTIQLSHEKTRKCSKLPPIQQLHMSKLTHFHRRPCLKEKTKLLPKLICFSQSLLAFSHFFLFTVSSQFIMDND